MGSDGMTTRTENLRDNLKSFTRKGVIIGQAYATLEGIGWQGDSDRSDIKEISGDHPAVTAYELKGIERGSKENSDHVAFSLIKKDALEMFRHGCLVTMTWQVPQGDEHQVEEYTKKVGAFIASLQDGYGIHAPVVLYPMPTGMGNWYDRLSAEEYQKLYHAIAETLDDEDVPNVLLGFATNMQQHNPFALYPEDEDIEAVCGQYIQPVGQEDSMAYADNLPKYAAAVARFAQDHQAAPALSTGIEGFSMHSLFSKAVLPVIQSQRLSYVLFPANCGEAKDRHYGVPFPGIDNGYIHDFMTLFNDNATIFRSKLNGLYLKR